MAERFHWFSQRPTVREWFKFCDHSDAALTRDQKQRILEEIKRTNQAASLETPLYLRILSGIGAVLAGMLLLYALYLLGLFEDQPAQLGLTGVGLMLVALIFHRLGLARSGLSQDFAVQIGLTFLQAGKAAQVTAMVQYLDQWTEIGPLWLVTLSIGIVGGVSYMLFASSLERFLAALGFLIALWLAMVADGPDIPEALLFSGLILLHLLALAVFLRWAGWQWRLGALYDALLVSLCIGVGLVATYVDWAEFVLVDTSRQVAGSVFFAFGQKWPTQILLTLSLLALILWVGRGHWWLQNQAEEEFQASTRSVEALVLACCGSVLLGLVSDPGILLSMGLLILGYATHRATHTLLGFVFALAFGVRFYYALQLSLLEKSVILVASGLLLLMAAGYIHWRGWHKRDVANG